MKKLFLIIFIISATSIFAEVIPASYKTVKSNAMGGTTILAEKSDMSLIYNPAMLEFIDKWHLSFLGGNIGTGNETFEVAKALQNMMDAISNANEDDVPKILNDYLDGTNTSGKNNDGNEINNKAIRADISGVIASYTGRIFGAGFGVGAFGNVNANEIALVNKPSSPELVLDMNTSLDVPLGISKSIGKNNQYSMGLSFRMVSATSMEASLGSSGLFELSDDNISDDKKNSLLGYSEYSGFSTNLGAVWQTKKLNYAFTLKDFINSVKVTKYENEEKIEEDDKLPLNLSIAISNKFTPEERGMNWYEKNIFWTVEIQNLLNKDLDGNGYDDTNFWKKLHAGAEIALINNKAFDFDFRVGLNQGYPTYGFGTQLFRTLLIDYAYFTKEVGPYIGSQEVNMHTFAFKIEI
ncbi:hypothetical protein EV215_1743 [Hypnocyclicus thermotrophus]|uniref:Uncharacterized protein n=1 Tax=Hypnocyclicus thermotrophus TaxID=1627895 RepID=A0AA46DXD2_9FUSO|nr:hypothetical protein [Hypnocyclicus thermotrophus]TDT68023.1 hypothetical protein EV215_1743 [Hypnocyclicus thermotrophus]